jgi:hypothetical protein
MRGKKIDKEFISEFINGCVTAGLETTEQIVAQAKKNIASIDREIQEISEKKKLRSKYLDVIITFEKTVKDKSEDAKLLPFFDMQYLDECKKICILLKASKGLSIDCVTHGISNDVTVFCFKQMIERKIIDRVIDQLVPGERFEEYWKLVLREE